MTLQQFLSKYKDASLSTYEKNLLEQCFDTLNLKYKNKNSNEQNTLIEQDPLYETIVYIFENKITYILTILPKSYIDKIHKDTISTIIDIRNENSNVISLLLTVCGENAEMFTRYCFAIHALNMSNNLNLHNLELVQFVCNCLDIDKGREMIKLVIDTKLDANKLNAFYSSNQDKFIRMIEDKNFNLLNKIGKRR